ncbi:MAG: phosphoribosylformylglycinamidine cyclo-ligase [Oscillospiraceae bacterium]|nr:phosphoribosylformylglycinamidine cyclo-ligase [Oscillospiraceae bacterium]MBP1570806.1 phosphoribosylformylglycinamidine cyclo-ligase [Oscillospiraceae bacterium]MBQ5313071.1 phosphoribosylformylglycinamidine cyclo-ligase [Oscillospiraceae bacterium]MBQ5324342.1 phosphoribosylformylglycinamidine cyclo-ligase [Oscillospiraceae bacterium]MBQ7006720.1 phosphoribosylformylglycinamidine cyclo-ligase [Oscillospiraceae bacterium]
MSDFIESYKAAGVDVTAGYKAVELMKESVQKTLTSAVLNGLGGFGGMYELPQGYEKPVLVSGTDGCGTKVKLAFLMDKHDTIGIDAVAMCVNDIVCCGAKPLFFLDYIAIGKNYPEKVATIVSGVAKGCLDSGCSLIGGETAEHPGLMPVDEYDIGGFAVGIVEKDKILNNDNVKTGDVLVAIPSSGVHSNGFSLVRKVFDVERADLTQYVESLGGTLGETLLTPTKLYVKPALAVLEEVNVKSIAHITGGGFFENIPRALPKGKTAKIRYEDVRVLPIFDLIKETGNIPTDHMFSTFNMGVGMVMVVSPEEADKTIEILKAQGEDAYVLGSVVDGEEGVILC